MSLINNVLNELERNKDEASRYASTLAGKKSGAWRFIYWILIVIIVCSIFWYYNPQLTSGLQKNVISFKKQSTKQVAPQPKVAPPQPTLQTQPQTQSYPAMIRLQNVVLERKNNQSVLDFMLSAPTSYYVEHESEQQLSITLNNTGVSGNLPISLENSFIVSLNTKQNKNNIVSTLTLLPGTKVDELQLITQPNPYLHIVLSNPQLANSSLSKVPAHLSPEEQAEQRYQEIQQLLAQDKTQNAIQRLHLFVGDFPNHMQARTILVSLLIKEGRLQKAQDVLMLGLKKYGDYAPFIKLRAHILLKQNKTTEAIDLLQKYVTSDDVEYLALLASLYQQQDSFVLAAKLYNQLTKIQPEKTAWWLGLGIALENAGKVNAAKEAYQRAYMSSDVSPELSSFLSDKIKR